MLHEETGLHHQILQRNHHRLPCGEAEKRDIAGLRKVFTLYAKINVSVARF